MCGAGGPSVLTGLAARSYPGAGAAPPAGTPAWLDPRTVRRRGLVTSGCPKKAPALLLRDPTAGPPTFGPARAAPPRGRTCWEAARWTHARTLGSNPRAPLQTSRASLLPRTRNPMPPTRVSCAFLGRRPGTVVVPTSYQSYQFLRVRQPRFPGGASYGPSVGHRARVDAATHHSLSHRAAARLSTTARNTPATKVPVSTSYL